jgi:three-Cys-motif partner protein
MHLDSLSLFDLPPEPKRKCLKPLDRPLWTENKAKLIEKYLFLFKMITRHGCYIDGFAGPQRPGHPETWAAQRVIENEPRWFRAFHLFEKKEKQFQYLIKLKESQEEKIRKYIHLYPGDFNIMVGSFLKNHPIKETEATFCLLDQRTFDCYWSTVRILAACKAIGNKVELFYLLPIAWLDRALSARKKNVVEITEWWGKDDWGKLRGMKPYPRAEWLCDRFKKELNYTWVYPWPIYKRGRTDQIMYFMIHATDYGDAPNLMNRAYNTALDEREILEQLRLDFAQWRATRCIDNSLGQPSK